MTKKDYEMIAKAIKTVVEQLKAENDYGTEYVAEEIAASLSTAFAEENPRFNIGKFMSACGLE